MISTLDLDIENSTLTPDVKRALLALSHDERKRLRWFKSYETGEFIGHGFIEHGQYTRLCDPGRMWIFDVLDEQLRKELSQL